VGDFPFDLPGDAVADRLLRVFDVEGKIARALETLGPLAGRDVVLLDPAPRWLAARLAGLGARLTVVDREAGDGPARDGLPSPDGPAIVTGTPGATALPDAAADVVVAPWSALCAPAADELAEADRILRPGGRLLVLQDYGRDDLDGIRGPERTAELVAWSRRDGWYLRHGFRIHVVHAFWTFESIEAAAALLRDLFGPAADEVSARLHRPRLAHNVVLYHRTRGDAPRPGTVLPAAGDAS
jgi:SAM-dependent methyltransferase